MLSEQTGCFNLHLLSTLLRPAVGWADHLILWPVLSPIPDAGKGEEEEDEEKDGMRLGLPTTPRNCIPHRGISVLEKLVKTCPVWLQLGLGQAEAAKILQREMAGVSQFCARQGGRWYSCEGLRMLPTEVPSCKQLLSLCFHLCLCQIQQWGSGEVCAGGIQAPEIMLVLSDFGS